MQTPIVVPDVGADATGELIVSAWLVHKGEEVVEGDRVVELLAGLVTFDVPAPATGRLVSVLRAEEDRVVAGAILGWLEVNGQSPS